METLKIYNEPERAEWAALTERVTRAEEEITQQVAAILAEIKAGGDHALRAITHRIEGREAVQFEIPATVRRAAAERIPAALKKALATAKTNIEAFHRAQLPGEVSVETMPGVRCVQRALPIRRVGLYVPGGKAPLFSTVLMLAVPARVAGCREVILCTPASREGEVAPEILYAAELCGVDRIFAVGGAQAVAAMAYGTESIPRVDKIFGPGNRYVTKAKQLVGANEVAVDLPAGPSEVLVLADDTASPAAVAADLLSQAEHGADSQAVLVCASTAFARDVQRAVTEQLKVRRRGEIIREALQHPRCPAGRHRTAEGPPPRGDHPRGVAAKPHHRAVPTRRPHRIFERLRPGAPDPLDGGAMERRSRNNCRRERLRGSLVARKCRRLRFGDEPYPPDGRLGTSLQRGEHRFVPAQDHLPGVDARRA